MSSGRRLLAHPLGDAQLGPGPLLGFLPGGLVLGGNPAGAALKNLGGGLLVDVLRADRPLRQDGHHVRADLDEAAVHEKALLGRAVADAQFAVAEPADQRRPAGQDAQLAVVHRQGHEVRGLVQDGPFRCYHNTLQEPGRAGERRGRPVGGSCHECYFPSPAIFLACSAASSMPPIYMKALSGRWSHLPSQSSLKLRIVSARGVTLPGRLVNASATMNGCDRKRSMRRARATTCLSSSLNSSTPRMAMMSWSSR